MLAHPLTPMRRSLLEWYRKHGRHDLPWRQTQDPWHVLLAELMLQRTRADLVAPVFNAVVGLYPTASALASAPLATVERLAAPLGLRHRVPRLHRAAASCRTAVPRTYSELMDVPGVGRYVATATLVLAYDKPLGVVDPSIIRILDRLGVARSSQARPRDDEKLWEAATTLTPRRNGRNWNLALLDLGASVCSSSPKCERCPLRRWCPTGSDRTAVAGRRTGTY